MTTPNLANPERRRLLSPAERSSEVLFGLIMVLAFTGSISVATSGREEIRELLIGALGCNLAWGIVDAVMYLTAAMTSRRREDLVHRRFAAAPTPQLARSAAAELITERFAELLTDEEVQRLQQRISTDPVRQRILSPRDFAAAAAVFALVFLCTLPVVLPFVIFHDAHIALRTSNAVAILLLYLAGHSLGRFSGNRPWIVGVSMVALGLALVGLTIALGG
jgi:hypothetical protein